MQKRGITISKYLDSKELTLKEVSETFDEVRRIDINAIHDNKKCANCGNGSNKYDIKSESWTGAYYCTACDSLMFILFSDRMGGNYTDVVLVFEQKNKPMYKLYFKCNIQKDCIECKICGTVSSDKNDIDALFCKKCNLNHTR